MGYTITSGRKVYDTESDRLRDEFPKEYTEGWYANDPEKPGWPILESPYTGSQNEAFNAGWNDRTEERDND